MMMTSLQQASTIRTTTLSFFIFFGVVLVLWSTNTIDVVTAFSFQAKSSSSNNAVAARTFTQQLLCPRQQSFISRRTIGSNVILNLSDWSDFADMDDDDDNLYGSSTATTNIQWADENDTPEDKAAVGSMLKAPEIDGPYYEPLVVPQGSQIDLSEENVQRLLSACRDEIQTMFGYTAQNRGVGITGGVDFVELDGPVVVLKLKGRFWHQRTTVLNRVGAYLMGRIPEIVDVVIDDPYELTDEANNSAE